MYVCALVLIRNLTPSIFIKKIKQKSTKIKEPEKRIQLYLVVEMYIERARDLEDKKYPTFYNNSLDGDDGIVGNVLEGIMRLK